jgi:hypothetical protein
MLHSSASPHLRHPPTHANKKKTPVVEELGRFALHCMASELEGPPPDEQSESNPPQPIDPEREQEQGKGKNDERDAERVADPVYRILVAAAVLRDPFVPASSAEHETSL